MRSVRSSIVSLALLVLIATGSLAQVSGIVSSDTTWTKASSPVTVSGTVTVPPGVALTIEPGTVVQFSSATGLIVQGKLVAVGTDADTVVFTSAQGSPSAGDWHAIEFVNSSDVGSAISRARIEYGGGLRGASIYYNTGAFGVPISHSRVRATLGHGIDLRSSSPAITAVTSEENTGYGIFSAVFTSSVIDSCTLVNNGQGGVRIPVNANPSILHSTISGSNYGIYIDPAATPTIQYNTIQGNVTGILFNELGVAQPSIKYNLISGNSRAGLENLSAGNLINARYNDWGSTYGPFHSTRNPSGRGDTVLGRVEFHSWKYSGPALTVTNITTTQSGVTWTPGVYRVSGSVVMNGGSVIQPGVIVKLASGAVLTISGTVTANGTPDSMIVFTSDLDDGFGGDSNGDGEAAQPAPGNWSRLVYTTGSGASSMRDVVIKFGGGGSQASLRVESVAPSIDGVTIANAAYTGLQFWSTPSVSVHGVTVVNSGNNGVTIEQNSVVSLVRAKIMGSAQHGVWMGQGTLSLLDSSIVSGNSGAGVMTSFPSDATYKVTSVTNSDLSQNGLSGAAIGSWTATTFSNDTFVGNGQHGLWYYSPGATATVNGNAFTNNIQDGLATSLAVVSNNSFAGNRSPVSLLGRLGTTFSGNTFGSSSFNAFGLLSSWNGTQVYVRDTLVATLPGVYAGKAYLAHEQIFVKQTDTLLIQAGTVLKFRPTTGLLVGGSLTADGTSGQPIVFTSYRDNAWGGKSTPSSDTTKAAPGDWGGFGIGNPNTLMDYCYIRFGGGYTWPGIGGFTGYIPSVGGGWNTILFNVYTSPTAPLTNIVVQHSLYYGVQVSDNSTVTFSYARIDSNGYDGIRMGQIIGVAGGARALLLNSTVSDNGGHGIYGQYQGGYPYSAACPQIQNTTIQRNAKAGVYLQGPNVPQSFVGNTVRFNKVGIFNRMVGVPDTSMIISGNLITNNTDAGIVSSGARYVDNTFKQNNYPIGVVGRAGNIYTDPFGFDGNVIDSNAHNRAIAVYQYGVDGEEYYLKGVLQSTMPAQMPNGVYEAVHIIRVAQTDTLTIQPGVVMKFRPTTGLAVGGVFTADGTPGQPIVFTSYRDDSWGGKTTPASDTTKAAPGDWGGFGIGNPSTVMDNCIIRFGGGYTWPGVGGFTGYIPSVGGAWNLMLFNVYTSPTAPLTNLVVQHSLYYGIQVSDNSTVTFTNARVDSNGYDGIRLAQVIGVAGGAKALVLNSSVTDNGGHGLYAYANNGYPYLSAFPQVQNSTILRNGGSGIMVDLAGIPQSILDNTIGYNGAHGVWANAFSASQDSLLIFSGNLVQGNVNAGIVSSRALFVDDTLTGNRYPLGFIGELSRDSTSTVNGNYYSGVVFSGNTFDYSIIPAGASLYGKLGAGLPPALPPVVVPLGDWEVASGKTLVVTPGTIVKFYRGSGSGGRLYATGKLLSRGSSGAKVVFTSYRDDTFGGDSNKDSTTTLPGQGDWYGLYQNGADSLVAFNTFIRYASYGTWFRNAKGTFDSSAASNNSIGIYCDNSSTPSVTASEIHHNATAIQTSIATPTVTGNNIYSNTTGLYHYSNTTMSATNNYWGHSSGPFVNTGADQNLSGLGNPIVVASTGQVNYKPFYVGRSGVLAGDVSQNGTISAYDASMVLQHVVSAITLTGLPLASADVSGNGAVTSYDASLILRYVVGAISGFPGLGKVVGTKSVAMTYDLRQESGSTPGTFSVVVAINNPSGVYSTDITLAYDKTKVTPVSATTTAVTNAMLFEARGSDGNYKVAMATATAINSGGDWVRVTFQSLDSSAPVPTGAVTLGTVQVNEASSTTSVGQEETAAIVPTEFGLDQNYPNPFNPTTTVRFALPENARVTVRVYNILGQEIRTLASGEMSAGFHTAVWDGRDAAGSTAASGLYLYRFEASGESGKVFTATKKMVLMK